MNSFTIPNEAAKYILFQRTNYLGLTKSLPFKIVRKLIPFCNYNTMVAFEARLRSKAIASMYLDDMKDEYESICDSLPETCQTILDIGCGMAGIDLFLNQHYNNQSLQFHLLDKTLIDEQVYYSHQQKGSFYNSLELAKSLLNRNGIDESRIHLMVAPENGIIESDISFDLILSLISWGFHYPVETYLDSVVDRLGHNGVLILDIRKGTNGLEVLRNRFAVCEIIQDTSKYLRIRAMKS